MKINLIKIGGIMTKKCIYCGAEISEEFIVDFCERCGIKVFGKRMFEAIIKNMKDAQERGDLYPTLPDDLNKSNEKNRYNKFDH